MSVLAVLLIDVLLVSLAYGIINKIYAQKRITELAHVIVLGRADQSPRMVEHAYALATHCKLNVVLIAYGNCPSKLPDNVIFCKLQEFPYFVKYRTIHYALSLLWVSKEILTVYFKELVPSITIVQNPPGLPILPLSYIYCKLVGSRFIVDWHNYGSSILAIKLSPDSWQVKLYWLVELLFGYLSDFNLCVSSMMARDLNQIAGIDAHIFYDRPIVNRPEPLTGKELHCQLTGKLIVLPSPKDEIIIVTSTSWTVDEPFDILWDALCKLEDLDRSILCIVTGKGPELENWKSYFESHKIANVRIIPMWLHVDIYPRLLSTAEIGVCLHMSSSGLDLPMKVQDMLGACLPVICFDYGPCIREISASTHIHDTKVFNYFTDSNSLASILMQYVKNPLKSKMGKEIIKGERIPNWQEEWVQVVSPHIRRLSEKYHNC